MTKKTTKKLERESRFAELFRGPWSTAEAAEIAGVDAPTVRNWRARSSSSVPPEQRVMQGRGYFWTRDAEPEPRDPRQAAMKLKAKLEEAGEDASWIEETLARMKQQLAAVEIVEAFVLAELARCGIAPGRARKIGKANLVEVLTRDLFERAYGEIAAPGRTGPADPPRHMPRGDAPGVLLVAEVHDDDTPDVLLVDDLLEHIRESPAATRIVIDPAKLFRRLVEKVEKTKAARATAEEPQP